MQNNPDTMCNRTKKGLVYQEAWITGWHHGIWLSKCLCSSNFSLPSLGNTRRAVYQKTSKPLLQLIWSYSQIPGFFIVILLLEFAISSILHLVPQLIPSNRFTRSCGPSSRDDCTMAWTCCSWPPVKVTASYVIHYLNSSNFPMCGKCHPYSKGYCKALCFFLQGGAEEYAKYINLTFAFEGISWYFPDPCTLKNFTKVASSCIFIGFVSYLWSACIWENPILFRQSRSSCPTIQHDIVNVIDPCDTLWDVKQSRSLWTLSCYRAVELTWSWNKTVNENCLSHVNAVCDSLF